MAVDNVGVNVTIKFGGSWSTGFRDIRGADFVSSERTNERTNIGEAYPSSAKRQAFRLKIVFCAFKMSVVIVSVQPASS